MKNIVLALLTGLLLGVSWPTYGLPIFIFIAFVPLLFAEYRIRTRTENTKWRVFVLSFTAFLVWNLLTTWWLVYAHLFGMLFANIVNALLMALVFLIYHIVAKRLPSKWALPFLICIWLSFEKLHLIWDFSWPWLNLGHAFAEFPQWIQWYEYTGSFGGSLWVLVVNAMIYYGISLSREFMANCKSIAPKAILVIALPIVMSLWMYSSYTPSGEKKQVVLLQPNIDPYNEKYQYTNVQMVDELIDLTQSKMTDSTELAIAPETVLAENLTYSMFLYSPAYRKLDSFSKTKGIDFLFGLDTYDLFTDPTQKNKYSNTLREGLYGNFYNKALLITDEYQPQEYLKSKLVVGIENFPFKPVLEPLLGNIMLDLGGTISTKSIQEDRSALSCSMGTKLAPIICYESVYGQYVTGYVKNGAEFLAVITNDAWWNDTQGHKQHLSFSRLRAIETRRDVARSANTGISAFINQKGDIVSRTNYNERVALRGEVQLNQKQTFYVQFGDYIAYLGIAGLVFFIVFTPIYTRKNKS